MTYDSPSSINASNGLADVLVYINNVTNGWISNMILIGIFILVIMGYYRAKDDFTGGLAIGGFATFVVALLFWLGGFVSGITLAVVVGIAILGVAILLMDSR